MKRLLFASLFLFSVSLFAQPVIDFETVGQDFNWIIFSNGPQQDSTDYAVVPNPSIGGLNSSSQCGRYMVRANGDPWSGIFTDDITPFTINASNAIMKVLVYKDVISNFNLKLEGFTGAHDNNVPNTVINQWEILTFDYTADIGQTVTRLTIIPDFPATRTAGSMNYFDNIFDAALPVELTSFTASYVGTNVQLKWSTATELNNRGFEIQRSAKGSAFATVAFVEGHGTTTEIQNYTFVDKSIDTRVSYSYRLKQIDFNGTSAYSSIVNLGITLPNEFTLEQNYPNPFNPSTKITYAVPVKSEVTLEVYNLIGQKMMTLFQGSVNAGTETVTMNATGLSSGIYLVKIVAVGENGSQFTSSKKMTLLK